MKESRHQKILEIIRNEEIYTQEGILEKLREAGFSVTQATVSRDIKKLNLIKVMTPSGKYKYICHTEHTQSASPVKYQSVFADAIREVDSAMNIVVIKCHVGFANAACAALDTMNLEGIVGTIAGDDTIFALMRSPTQAEYVVETIRELINR
ncbi:Arginine hydroxamate resistance protein [uncultured Ruminococcus sp.]|uniref:Arginine repressor n=1 Tax=Massiliimalia timonensis TaxID=1987501 RepID=A0A8J6PD22_9FIRM|nr:arginine repressor [Massiliimalia timonensis]MBC8609842.1 arginine repressor [Massiliimalia timonensis]MBS7175213.1 arginine repressor [Clostridiales bacterium]SCH22810.1 Arginine hydroxamate resistance protein [uncultured Ruminococcus sp.]SCH27830.1 Arginine hydroxamate resistance protein [uncultured Clostridium sp.]